MIPATVEPVQVPLYSSDRGLYGFQEEHVARAYLHLERGGGIMAVWDTGCLYADAEIVVNRAGNSRRYPLSEVVRMFNGGKASNGHGWRGDIPTMVQHEEADGTIRLTRLIKAWVSGVKQTYTVTTSTGRTLRATDEHPFLTARGWLRLDELKVGDEVHVRGEQARGQARKPKPYYRQVAGLQAHPFATHPNVRKGKHRVPTHRLAEEAYENGLTFEAYVSRLRSEDIAGLIFLDPAVWAVHHRDHNSLNNHPDNLQVMTHAEHHRLHADEGKTASVLYKVALEEVVSVEPYGEEMTYDLEVEGNPHNFLADGFVVHNTGKSHLAMAVSALMIEDDLIDIVLLVAERTKISADEWPADLDRFTGLTHAVHHGTGRMQRLAKQGLPQVLVTTYQTGKLDLSPVRKVPGTRRKEMVDGPLLEMLKGKRVLVVLDESTVVKNRTADVYKSWFRTLGHLRKGEVTRVLEMTATPIERDWEDAYSQLRLADPEKMPLVKDFQGYFVRGYDGFDRPYYHQDRMPEFAKIAAPMILRIRKSDPEVMAEFPKQVEEARWFEMAADQEDLYERLCDLQEPGHEPVPGLMMLKRMVVNHPASVIHSARYGTSKLARILVEEWGEDYFRSVSSVKEQGLIDYLEPVVHGQGAKVVVFSFFGPSVLPLLEVALRRKKFVVYNTAGLSLTDLGKVRQAFKDEEHPAVLLSSDAGARGVNLPQASYVVEYESALTYAMRTQRINRAHRIDSTTETVTCLTFFTHRTVEESIANAMIERNHQQDVLLDDLGVEDFLTSVDRRDLLRIRRTARSRRGTTR